MDHDHEVGGSGQLRAESKIDFADIDHIEREAERAARQSDNIEGALGQLTAMFGRVARELRGIRVALDHRNGLLAESNAISKKSADDYAASTAAIRDVSERVTTPINVSVNVEANEGDAGAAAAKIADALQTAIANAIATVTP